jgi:HEPN domain-containing protein/predicted nucleotidyltransferase
MKQSLAHLPTDKQSEINRIVETIKEVMNPEKIILFGSYAKGTYVDHRYHTQDGIENEYISDYDFLIVTKDEPIKPYLQESTIMDRVNRYRPPVNLEIHSLAYVNDGLSWGQYFFTDIINEGISLYDSGIFAFAAPRILTAEEEKQKALDYFNNWFERAVGFMKLPEVSLTNNDLRIGVFTLHQAAESLYFTVLLVFNGYKPRIHNLWKLRKKSKPYSEELFGVFKAETDKNDERLFELLKKGYIDARYKDDFVITYDDLSTLIKRVTTMFPMVEKLCKERIEGFTKH